MEPQQPRRKTEWINRHRDALIIAVVIVVVLIVIPIVADVLIFGVTGNYNSKFVASDAGWDCQVPAGTIYPVDNFSLKSASFINGTFSASKPISFFISTQNEFSNFFFNGTLPSYLFGDKNVVSGTVNLSVSAGNTYLIFLNTNNETVIANYNFSVTKVS